MTRLNQSITRWQGIGLMATTLLGTGVFILPQLTLEAAGELAIWAWILLLAAILPIGFIFAQLGKHFSHAAGPAYFVEKAFGKRYGQMVGLLFLCVVPLGMPAALIMTFEFLKPIIMLTPLQALLGQLGIFVLLFFMNLRSLQLSGQVQLILTLTILGVILAMLIGWGTQPQVEVATLPNHRASGLFAAIGLAVWSFLGIEAITHLSAEFKDARRDFVPAVMGGVVLVGIIFIACTYLSSLAPNSTLAMVGAYELLLGDSGRWVIGILGMVSGLATVNIYSLSLSRLAWSFSQEGVLPSYLSHLNQHQVPSKALITTLSVGALVLILSYQIDLPFETMVRWTNGVFIIIYLMSMFAAWRLLAPRHRPMIMVGVLACIIFVISLGTAMIYSVVLMTLLFIWTGWRHKTKVNAMAH